MLGEAYALRPDAFLRSIAASRDTLGRRRMNLLEIVAHVRELGPGAEYAVIGGLAQILWARKTHTDDLDVALAATDLAAAVARVRSGQAPHGWTLPQPPDRDLERDDVIEVAHLLYDGAVVDLIAFQDQRFNAEVIATARAVPELNGIRFIRPELLLVTHLLRPGATAALAAVELILAREQYGGMDLDESRRWAEALGRGDHFAATLERVRSFAPA